MIPKIKQWTLQWDSLAQMMGRDPASRFVVLDFVDAEMVNGAIERSISLTNAMAMVFCYEGSVMSVINGVSQSVSSGDLCVLLPGVYSQFHTPTPNLKTRVLFVRASTESGDVTFAEAYHHLSSQAVFTLEERERSTLIPLWDYIHSTIAHPNAMYSSDMEYVLASLLKMELSSIIARYVNYTKAPSAEEQMAVRFNILLTTKAAEHRDVEWYAQYFNLSPKQFATKIRRVVGHNPSEMIERAVIQCAKNLLATTPLSSSEISERLNFATPSFFCRYFKRYTGVTPQEWREKNLQK